MNQYPNTAGNNMKKIRILVVEDHSVVRDGIIAILSLQTDIEVVGETAFKPWI
jgi:hypothetical protein